MTRPAIFIDKDGTLIPDVPYNVNPDLIRLAPGAGDTLQRFIATGYLLVVISNQAGIARGLFTEADLVPVRNRINTLLAGYGVSLDGFYYCPHSPDGTIPRYAIECNCRKPQPGMLTTAARDLKIDLARSWMIGDITADSEAGHRAGCHTILIEKPYDPILEIDSMRPDFIVNNWNAAGQIIFLESS